MTNREIWQHGIHSVSITCLSGGTNVGTITNEDIVQGTFKVNQSICDGEKLSFGGCIASSVEMTLINNDGRFDTWTFPGMVLKITMSAKLNDEVASTISLPEFTVDNAPVIGNTISIIGYDRLVKLDTPVWDASYMNTHYAGYTVFNLAETMLGRQNLYISNSYYTSNLYLANVTIKSFEEDVEYTPRNIIRWCCELLGAVCYAYMSGVEIRRYNCNFDSRFIEHLTEEDRISSTKDNTITIKGLKIAKGEVTGRYGKTLSPNELDYTFDITDNPLKTWTGDVTTAKLNNLAMLIYRDSAAGSHSDYSYGGTSDTNVFYNPCEIHCYPYPELGFSSAIANDYGSTETYVYPTNVTFGINQEMIIASIGKSAESEGYASGSIFSPTAISNLQKYVPSEDDIRNYSTARGNDIKHLNEFVARGLGFYATQQQDGDGRITYFWHDASDLENSGTVYKYTANGVVWTTNYQSAAPVWHYGISSEGDAVFRNLSVQGLTANNIKTGILQSIETVDGTVPKAQFDLDHSLLKTIGGVDIVTEAYPPTVATARATMTQADGFISIELKVGNETYATIVIGSNGIHCKSLKNFCYKPDNWDSMSTSQKNDYYRDNAYHGAEDMKLSVGNGYSRMSATGISFYDYDSGSGTYIPALEYDSGSLLGLTVYGPVIATGDLGIVVCNGISIGGNGLADFVVEEGGVKTGGWRWRKWNSGLVDMSYEGNGIEYEQDGTASYSKITKVYLPFKIWSARMTGEFHNLFYLCNVSRGHSADANSPYIEYRINRPNGWTNYTSDDTPLNTYLNIWARWKT